MKSVILLFLLVTLSANAQHTIEFTKESTSPKANLADVSWITGHWKGEAFGGAAEEIWSPPLGDSMMFVFKLVVDDKVVFYEIGHIREVEKTLLLQLKHFHGTLKGWEEKDETVDFRLVKLEENHIYFDKFTFEKISENEINLYVVIGHDDGSSEEMKFNYKKQL